MPVDYRFSVPSPAAEEEAAVKARMYQSDTYEGAKAQVGSDQAISGLSADPVSGLLMWNIATADSTKHSWLAFLTASGTEGEHAHLSPQAASADQTLLVIDLEAIGLAAKEGVEFSVELYKTPTTVDTVIIDPEPLEKETDANGHLELILHRGAKYKVRSRALKQDIVVDTDGLATVDLYTLII